MPVFVVNAGTVRPIRNRSIGAEKGPRKPTCDILSINVVNKKKVEFMLFKNFSHPSEDFLICFQKHDCWGRDEPNKTKHDKCTRAKSSNFSRVKTSHAANGSNHGMSRCTASSPRLFRPWQMSEKNSVGYRLCTLYKTFPLHCISRCITIIIDC